MLLVTRLTALMSRFFVPGIFALVGLSLALAVGGRLSGAGAALPDAALVAQRDLVFQDRADGAVVASAGPEHRTVAVFEGEQGFLRGTLRGLARTRKADAIAHDLPFRLARWSDGRLTLDDPATGRHVELLAFGAENAMVFARLLERPE